MTDDPRYGTPQWKRTRTLVLARDDHRCQIRGPRCRGYATEADHIEAVIDGGAFWQLTNLRAACRPCNAGRGAEHTNRRRHAEPEYLTRF